MKTNLAMTLLNPSLLGFASALIGGFGTCASAGEPAPNKPNVVIVLTDDQGYGDLSCTGNPILKTPNMDRLADQCVRFTNFHVDSYCAPTRSALMTGRYSHRVGGWGTVNGRNMLRDDEVTMADVFRHNGYRTGIFGKWHLGSNYPYRPIDRGFDEWLGQGDGGTGCTTDYWGNDRVNDHYLHNGLWEKETRPGFQCDVYFDAAMQFIRENKQRSFFTYLAAYNPHNPCSVPDQQWLAPYRDKVTGPLAHLFASVARIDANLGRLRTFLADEGLAENTVLIFLSDNGTAQGEEVFNAGMRGKKGEPYEGGHRVPCFLHWPGGGFDKSLAVDRLAAHLDLLPTLVDLCGLQLPTPISFDGTSLKPLLTNPDGPWPERTLVMGSPHNETGANPPPPKYGQRCAVMTDHWRLVNDCELYDLTTDPGQTRDAAAEFPAVVKDLHQAYQRYWDSVSAKDTGWRGRPIIGSSKAPVVELSAEDWYSTKGACPWNQGSVAAGRGAFGRWPVRFAEAGRYEFEVRRWPREAAAPLAGIPAAKPSIDALLPSGAITGLLYDGVPKALPVARVRLKLGAKVLETSASVDSFVSFTTEVETGPADIEATLLDASGKELCGAFYISARKAMDTKPTLPQAPTK